jgi:uroporphyrin-3 C-methyltransferase
VNNPDIDTEFDPFENDPGNKKSRKKSGAAGAGVAWLALLLGLAAISYNAWRWWQDQAPAPTNQAQLQSINNLQQANTAMRETLDSLQNRVAIAEQRDDSGALSALRSDIGAIQSRLSELGLGSADDHAVIEALQSRLDDLSQRLSDIETSVAALAVRSETPGKSMDLAEVDYLLRLASERLTLFGDVRSAGRALGLADTHLEALEDPLYLPVRRRISEARQSLQDLPQPDLLAISGQIESLQAAIPGLPFPGEAPVIEEIVAADPDAGWWQRIKSAIKPLVKVRRRTNPEQELSLEDKDYLRQGLWLQLETARLAVMRNDAVAWNHALTRARESLTGRFETGSKAVTSALQALDALQAIELAGDIPDISQPWRQLQLLREGRARTTATPAAAVVSEPAEERAPVESGIEPVSESDDAQDDDPPADGGGNGQ